MFTKLITSEDIYSSDLVELNVRGTASYLLSNSVALGSDCGFNVDLSHFVRDLNEANGKPVALSSLQLLPL